MSQSTCCRECLNRIVGKAKCKEDRDQCQRSPDVCGGIAQGLHTASKKCCSCRDFTPNDLFANAVLSGNGERKGTS